MGNTSAKSQKSVAQAPTIQNDKDNMENKNQDRYKHIEKKIGVGIIGIGARMCDVLANLLHHHGGLVNIIAVADDAPQAIEETKDGLKKSIDKYCNVDSNVLYFTDYNELLKLPEVEWVLIGSKNYLHRDHCVAAFKAGKHVFCEKPLAINFEQCLDIRSAHMQSQLLFATGFVLRHAPMYKTIHEMIHSGKLGKIVSIEANELLSPSHGGFIFRNWRRYREFSGPFLLEKCCHDIDILNWMTGSLPARVASFGGRNVFVPENEPQSENDMDVFTAWTSYEDVNPFTVDKDVEDHQVVILEYYNSIRATFHMNACSPLPQRKLLICCTKGSIEGKDGIQVILTAPADLISGSLVYRETGYNKRKEEVELSARGIHGGADDMIVDDLAHAMETKSKTVATGEEGFLSAVVCLAIDEAYKSKQVVELGKYWNQFGVNVDTSNNNTK